MSVESPTARERARTADPYEPDKGSGWVAFAGVMLMIVGSINFIGGIAAVDDSSFYVGETRLIFDDLNTWGWFLIATGTVQVLAAMGIWARNTFASILGITFASLNMVVQLLIISAFPLWSLAIIAIDVLIIYGLLAYGGRGESRA
jgi:hypothetical protein